jgi:DNA-binding IclR family transcriptional regulator
MSVERQPSTARYEVPSIKRAFAILDTLGESSFGLTVREVSMAHKLPYSTVFYLLETMRESGYVERNDKTKKYVLGYKVMALRNGVANPAIHQLRTVAAPLLAELSEITELTGHLAILERDEAIYIYKHEPQRFVRLNTWVGKRNSLHSTAVGKALLLGMPSARIRDRFQQYPFTRKTEKTITSLAAFCKEIEVSAIRGYAVDDCEDEHEGRCMAAAVRTENGDVIAAMGISGIVSQVPPHKIEAVGKLVRDYAQRASSRLGYVSQAVLQE